MTFEETLASDLQKIFEVHEVTFDQPGESLEQECLFVEIEVANCRVVDGRFKVRAQGKITMNAPSSKLPIGFFAKAIAARSRFARNLFFYDIEASSRLYNDIVQRSLSFIYFFNSQYDPAIGTITSVTPLIEVQE